MYACAKIINHKQSFQHMPQVMAYKDTFDSYEIIGCMRRECKVDFRTLFKN